MFIIIKVKFIMSIEEANVFMESARTDEMIIREESRCIKWTLVKYKCLLIYLLMFIILLQFIYIIFKFAFSNEEMSQLLHLYIMSRMNKSDV